jgi:hypothetical protein
VHVRREVKRQLREEPLMFQACPVIRAASEKLRRVSLLALAAPCLVAAAASADSSPQAAFFAENEVAMTRMMADMNVKPSGNVDRDFAAMMIPHHQGAIDMAEAELRYGHDERLRRLAQEIIVSQTQEIAVMHAAMSSLPASGAPSTDGAQGSRGDVDSHPNHHH